MQIRPTIYTRLYRDFLAIEPKNYHAIIRYYEQWEAQIAKLDDDQHYELLIAFTPPPPTTARTLRPAGLIPAIPDMQMHAAETAAPGDVQQRPVDIAAALL